MTETTIPRTEVRPGDVIVYGWTSDAAGLRRPTLLRVISTGINVNHGDRAPHGTTHRGPGGDADGTTCRRWWARVEAVDEDSARATFSGEWSIALCLDFDNGITVRRD